MSVSVDPRDEAKLHQIVREVLRELPGDRPVQAKCRAPGSPIPLYSEKISHGSSLGRRPSEPPVEIQVQEQHIDPRLAEKPEGASVGP
jgi:hypothetical protein